MPGPIAVIHGMNSSCPMEFWTEAIAEAIEYKAVVKCIEFGDGITDSLFFRNDWQAAKICQKLMNDPDFAGKEISLVGMSQGGIVARAIVERCDGLKVHTLMTYGAPHAGNSVPLNGIRTITQYWHEACDMWWCPFVDHMLRYFLEFTLAWDWGAPQEYCRPWWSADRYYEHSSFLPRLNNELPDKDAKFKERLTNVKNFGMWRWVDDFVVVPRDSSWFFSWDEERHPIELKELQMYEEDWVGLKTLYESDRLFFYTGKGDHMHLE